MSMPGLSNLFWSNNVSAQVDKLNPHFVCSNFYTTKKYVQMYLRKNPEMRW